MFSIIWDPEAEKAVGKLDILTARRILRKVVGLQEGPHSDVIRLKGSPDYRLRVGDYLVIFSVKGTELRVVKIGHRKNIYD
ncbi:type II toxin-antitoxin system RelE/ParE family toxin [Candidatus Woesearchaeota archaeon]|nr:type II toxin-antitoxin system RelE/ParE family toxin [Candidatus Woesearchaeota archaeon]